MLLQFSKEQSLFSATES